MEDEIVREWAAFVVIIMIAPYALGFPIAIAWVATALFVRWLTGWNGLLPADVWRNER
jgi:hypothetical protein